MRSTKLLFWALVISISVAVESFADIFGNPTFRGTGCSSKTVSTLVTDDAVTFLFDSFRVSTEPGEGSFRWCEITLPLRVARGFSASVTSVDHRGFAAVEAGANGYVWSYYWLATREFGTSPVTHLKGIFNDDFVRRDVSVYRSSLPACGGGNMKLKISLFALVSAKRRARASVQMDSTDGVVQVKLNSKRCR